MESVVSDSFCITIFGWGIVVRNASPNVAYSTISACRCRQMRPFVSSSPWKVLYGVSLLKRGHFLRHFSPHDCARASLRYPGAQWKLPSGYFFSCTCQSSYFPPSTPICSREFAAHLSRLLLALISTLLLPHLVRQLQAVRFCTYMLLHASSVVVSYCNITIGQFAA